MDNHTQIIEFLLVGFPSLQNFKIIMFVIILTFYILILASNFLMVIMVLSSPQLQSPMYYFLSNLSVSDILLTTDIVPFMLYNTIRNTGSISFIGCIIQYYFYGGSACAECLILTVMSYDRYLAICNPLHYSTLMDFKLQLRLVIFSWSVSWIIPFFSIIMLSQLRFCDLKIINHFFCDLAPILHISCSDAKYIYYVELEALVASVILILIPFLFVTATYIYIFLTILSIPSSTGRQKAFFTCSSHLTVVCTFYGTMITQYTVPSNGRSMEVSKCLSLLYAMVTPLLNPIIYSLRNTDIRTAMKKLLHISDHHNSPD